MQLLKINGFLSLVAARTARFAVAAKTQTRQNTLLFGLLKTDRKKLECAIRTAAENSGEAQESRLAFG